MSWKYRLFKKPQTVEEFADKAKRTGQTKTDVIIREFGVDAIAFADDRKYTNYFCSLELSSGKNLLRVKEEKFGDSIVGINNKHRKEIQYDLQERAKAISAILRNKGISVILRSEDNFFSHSLH